MKIHCTNHTGGNPRRDDTFKVEVPTAFECSDCRAAWVGEGVTVMMIQNTKYWHVVADSSSGS